LLPLMPLYSSHTDEQLLLLLKEGNEAAFTEIYRRFWKLLFSVAANKLNDPEDAKELVQDVFVNLWKRHAELTIDHSIKAYLAGAVKFRVYTLLSHKEKRRRQEAGLIPAPSSSTPYIEDQVDLIDLMAKVELATAQLPERCRLVFRLSRDEGFSRKEIAKQLNISEKTVENQITKALHHLRTALRSVFFSILFFLL
ncbi:MAG TPA: RNA polymerase sigma-70 factor, partial [Puia sp.]|nr:RNA polymerase sigma-70 factor [Puia sp.]